LFETGPTALNIYEQLTIQVNVETLKLKFYLQVH